MKPLPSPPTGLPRYPNHHAYVPCPLPRRIETGAYVDYFPVSRGLPRTLGGSASALSFSRPAQASLALRPARSLNRPRRPLSRGFDGAGYPATPPVSYQLNRQLAGWNPPPQVFRAFGAHQRLQTCTDSPVRAERCPLPPAAAMPCAARNLTFDPFRDNSNEADRRSAASISPSRTCSGPNLALYRNTAIPFTPVPPRASRG